MIDNVLQQVGLDQFVLSMSPNAPFYAFAQKFFSEIWRYGDRNDVKALSHFKFAPVNSFKFIIKGCKSAFNSQFWTFYGSAIFFLVVWEFKR